MRIPGKRNEGFALFPFIYGNGLDFEHLSLTFFPLNQAGLLKGPSLHRDPSHQYGILNSRKASR